MPSEGLTPLDAPANAVEVLGSLDLLAPATEDDVRAVAEVVDWCRCNTGSQVFGAGDRSDGVYLVVRGRLESHVNGTVLGEIGRGGTFGETAMLGGMHRTASVRAIRDSVLVRLPAERFARLAATSPQVAVGLARLVAIRAAAGTRPIRRTAAAKSIAVISVDDTDSAASLPDSLAGRLEGMVSVRRILGTDIEAWAEAGGHDEVIARLTEAEDGSETVLVSVPTATPGDDGPAGGSTAHQELLALVLRQMDVVVAAVAATGRPDAAALDLLGRVDRPVSLVLVHRPGRRPSGTGRWLELLGTQSDVRSHVQVRERDPDDLDRLARTLIGRSVGVVLGGGGSRGFAHIGVLRALREAGVSVDLIGGSSMGAIMGAQAAMGWSPEEMLARNINGWSRRQFIELGLPTLSLLRGRRATRVLEGFFGDWQIEDLWLDYFCTTVDLSVCRLNVATRGPVADWVRASATVPGLWPPLVDDDGHLHVDGGMLDNIPTDMMRSSHSGTVIGVDVCNRQSAMRVPPRSRLPSGISLLRARSRGTWFPSILDVVNRSNLLASLQQHEEAARYADLFITPPAEEAGFAAFDRVDEIAEIGYRWAADVLEETDLSAFS
jgi:NTE family protein